ncbi:interleukin 21 receptor, tandem duplicate 2 [Astyanax mexicanus]|uniref:interleukin 21 receptor, tandem duplicate 2 n=1 Tax=Astyanax mexicanus TaxID=7994 RepID=UPI0020CB698C|nr:interleukin 21 receptor, tandem duplicate 2 [Astyanax mexicanus]
MMLALGVLSVILSIMQTSKATESKGLTCETDYWLTINCSLDPKTIPNRSEHTSYWLEFHFQDIQDNIKIYNCSLTEKENGYYCRFKAVKLPYFPTFSSALYFAVYLSYLENGLKKSSVLDHKFYPVKHIRPINPHNLTLEVVNRSYHFKWVSGYEEHTYESSLPRLYKFFYHKEQQDTVLSPQFFKTECSIPEHDLEAGIRYVSWVCTEISNQNNDYKGVGSSCSSPITWSTTPTEKVTPDPTAPLLSSIVTVICLGAVALIFMLLCPAARMKIKKVTWVATPSPFFQPLFHNHQGNFKDWVSRGDVQITYSEEISKIDMMTEIRAEEKCLQKFSSTYSSPQYHTPYVSPASEVWAPFQISETQSVGSISCKDLDFLPEEPAVEEPTMLCLTMFEPITVEGLLCMDDLEFSQEDLEPPEPETTAPKPAAFPQNYCTLTNTPTGLIPTLTTGPSGPELTTEASEHALNLQIQENTDELVPLSLDSLQLSMD